MAIVKKNLINKTLKQILFIVLIALVAGFASNLFRTDRISFVESRSGKTNHVTLPGNDPEISLEEAVKLFRINAAIFMDARPLEEYNKGHIKGAISLPYEEADQKFAEVMSGISEDNLIVTYCDGETCELSMDLAVFLRNAGYKKVWALANGWSVWQENNLPVGTDK